MPTIIRSRPAGPEHAVTTFNSDSDHYRRRPCKTCPWRRDAIGVFPAEAFRHSAATGYDGSHIQDQAMLQEALHNFACHRAGTAKSAICAGYILRSEHALGWRMAVVRGRFDPTQVSDGGHALFANYREMAIANGVAADDPIIAACR